MKCDLIRNLMSSYIDNELNEIERAEFEKHLAECPECLREYEMLLEIVTDCNTVEEVDLPEGFRAELHQRLLAETQNVKKDKKVISLDFFRKAGFRAATGLVAATLVLAIGIGVINNGGNGFFGAKKSASAQEAAPPGMGGSDGTMAKSKVLVGAPAGGEGSVVMYDKAGAAPAANEATYGLAAPEAGPPINGGLNASDFTATTETTMKSVDSMTASRAVSNASRKVIVNGSVSLKLKDVETKAEEIKQIAVTSGGYVENSYVDNTMVEAGPTANGQPSGKTTTIKMANIIIHVPANQFEDIFKRIKAMGKVVNENVSGSDITMQYADTDTRVKNLKIEEQRLQELLTKATTVNDMLQIENELNRIRTERESLTGQLKQWDNLVELSTINVSLTELKEGELQTIDVPNIWDRARIAFINTINNIIRGLSWLFVSIIAMIPYLIALAIAAFIAYRIWKKKRTPKVPKE